jgi:ABC-type branched-subunit amino acid transport system substrate-binding protein
MIPTRRTAVHALLAATVAVSAACSVSTSDEPPPVRIAFFQDLTVPDHVDLVSPSFLALDTVVQRRLAGAEATVEVVQLDTGGDASTAVEMAREVAADPTYALAVAAPFWHEPTEVAAILAEAGVPTISLSPVSPSPWGTGTPPPGDAGSLWRRFVPDRSLEADLLADLAARRTADGEAEPVCIVRDGSPYGEGLAEQVGEGLDGWPATSIDGERAVVAAGRIAATGCRVVLWAGFPPGARELARAMRAAGSARGRPVDLAGDALKTTIPPTSPAGDGVVVGSVACPCADVSTGLALASRRFVNTYQSAHGLIPGIYAAEGWDAGRLVAGAIAAGATDRGGMQAALASIQDLDGVARRYRFDATGELLDPDVGVYVASGTRWLPVPA